MKTLVLSALLLSTTNAFAARDLVSLDCVSKRNRAGEMTLKVGTLFTSDDLKEGSMRDVIMTWKADGETKVQTGRAKSVDNDTKYRPTKYKDHLRFDMNQMTDVADFSKYYPDGCTTNAMVPNDVVTSNANRVEVPVVMNCEQSGGTVYLDCKVKTER